MDVTSTSPVGQSPESKLHFLDYWRIIRIRKTVILAVFLLVVITTTVMTLVLKKTYMSTARIEVGQDMGDIALLMQGGQTASHYDPFFIRTEFEKIKAQSVLSNVVVELGLADIWSKTYATSVRLTTQETIDILKKVIDTQETRNTSLIEIRAFSEDPKEAAAIANKVAEVYQRQRLEKSRKLSQSGIEAFKAEYSKQSNVVLLAQVEVDKLRKQYQISDMGDSLSQTTLEPETVRAIERDRIQADQTYAQLSTLYKGLKEMNRVDQRRAIPVAWPDEALTRYTQDLGKAEQMLSQALKEYGEEHPQVKQLMAMIKTVDRQIEDRVDGVLSGLEVRVKSAKAVVDELAAHLEAAKKKDTDMMEKYRPYFAAKRDLENKQRMNEQMSARIMQETIDSKIPRTGMVEIHDPALPISKPVRPNVTLNIILGVVVGLVMGFGLAFFIEYLDTSVKTIDDVERALQSPVLGVIPQNVGSLLEEGVDSPHAEAYRVLRTNILFSRKTDKASTITVVSGGAGEGKSTTIFNLATIFAQNGSRVLLVDSDLRRPSLHKILNVSNSMGLTNFLMKQNTIEEVVQRTPVPLLDFLPSGKLPSSSLGVLNSVQMRDFMVKAKERYDYVFFDSPPIMGVSDASVLASEVDISILVIQYRKYPQAMTIRAKQMVEKVGGNLLGVVLNNINISQDSYYYYYSGYYYDYYSKQDDNDPTSGGGKGGAKGSKDGKSAKSTDRAALDIKPKY